MRKRKVEIPGFEAKTLLIDLGEKRGVPTLKVPGIKDESSTGGHSKAVELKKYA